MYFPVILRFCGFDLVFYLLRFEIWRFGFFRGFDGLCCFVVLGGICGIWDWHKTEFLAICALANFLSRGGFLVLRFV